MTKPTDELYLKYIKLQDQVEDSVNERNNLYNKYERIRIASYEKYLQKKKLAHDEYENEIKESLESYEKAKKQLKEFREFRAQVKKDILNQECKK